MLGRTWPRCSRLPDGWDDGRSAKSARVTNLFAGLAERGASDIVGLVADPSHLQHRFQRSLLRLPRGECNHELLPLTEN